MLLPTYENAAVYYRLYSTLYSCRCRSRLLLHSSSIELLLFVCVIQISARITAASCSSLQKDCPQDQIVQQECIACPRCPRPFSEPLSLLDQLHELENEPETGYGKREHLRQSRAHPRASIPMPIDHTSGARKRWECASGSLPLFISSSTSRTTAHSAVALARRRSLKHGVVNSEDSNLFLHAPGFRGMSQQRHERCIRVSRSSESQRLHQSKTFHITTAPSSFSRRLRSIKKSSRIPPPNSEHTRLDHRVSKILSTGNRNPQDGVPKSSSSKTVIFEYFITFFLIYITWYVPIRVSILYTTDRLFSLSAYPTVDAQTSHEPLLLA